MATQETLRARVDNLEKTIRGGDGEHGLVTDVAVIKNCVGDLARDIDELWNEMKKANASRTELHDAIVSLSSKIDILSHEVKEARNEAVNFRWFLEKVILPILLPFIGSAIAIGITLKSLH